MKTKQRQRHWQTVHVHSTFVFLEYPNQVQFYCKTITTINIQDNFIKTLVKRFVKGF